MIGNLDDPAQLNQTLGTFLHEVTHILGQSESLFALFPNRDGGFMGNPFDSKEYPCVNSEVTGVQSQTLPVVGSFLKTQMNPYGDLEYLVVDERLKEIMQSQYNCRDDATIRGAVLENRPTSAVACFGSHFKETYSF